MIVSHRFRNGIPICGTPRGVNAADLQPPEITCQRCKPTPPEWWERQVIRKEGKVFLAPTELGAA